MTKPRPHAPAPPSVDTRPLIEIAPPQEMEDSAPPLASHVVVSGGIDAMRLEFYFIPFTRMRAVLRNEKHVTGVEKRGEWTTVRSTPVARVSIPASVVAELLAAILETFADGVDDATFWAPAALARINKSAELIQALSTKIGQRSVSQPPEVPVEHKEGE